MFILSLFLLIAAFLGLNLNGDTGSTGPCTAGYSPRFENVAPGDYSDEWYAWEWCLFNGGWPAERDFNQHGTRQQSLQVAQFFVNGLWRHYTPWMEAAIEADAPSMNASVKGKVKPPTAHMGQAAVAEHCPVGSFGCGSGGSCAGADRSSTTDQA